jgi:hypothetical protein
MVISIEPGIYLDGIGGVRHSAKLYDPENVCPTKIEPSSALFVSTTEVTTPLKVKVTRSAQFAWAGTPTNPTTIAKTKNRACIWTP